MWKYIISGAVVLLLGSTFFFYKNNEALTSYNGEIAAVQSQFSTAVKKSHDIALDQAIKRYADVRIAHFKQEQDRFDEEKTALEAEDVPVVEEITQAQADLETAKADFQRFKEEFAAFRRSAAEVVELEDADEDVLNTVGQKLAELVDKNNAAEAQVAQEQATIAELGAESEVTLNKIAAARKLNSDRMARLSPPELSCTVVTADPDWDYVILDAGINKGIVIGSRLAVMRGDTKVCELNVTLVESNRSSCDVVYSTIRPGDRVVVGDKVIAVRSK